MARHVIKDLIILILNIVSSLSGRAILLASCKNCEIRNMLVPASHFLQHFVSPIGVSIAMVNVNTQHFAVTHVSKLYKTQQNSQGSTRNHCKSYTMRSVKKRVLPDCYFKYTSLTGVRSCLVEMHIKRNTSKTSFQVHVGM